MPTDKDFKRLVRQRMAETGERFTAARVALSTGPADTTNADPAAPTARDLRWIQLLGDPHQNQGAFELLKDLPAEQLRQLAVTGTRHANPKVRRRSCQLLDDLPLTPESVSALEACTADEDPRVRGAALHTLGCGRCKPDGVCLDQRAIAERAVGDRSAKVRRGVAMTLSWSPQLSDDWSVGMATRLLADPSAQIRRYRKLRSNGSRANADPTGSVANSRSPSEPRQSAIRASGSPSLLGPSWLLTHRRHGDDATRRRGCTS
jgi:hypothetical protein